MTALAGSAHQQPQQSQHDVYGPAQPAGHHSQQTSQSRHPSTSRASISPASAAVVNGTSAAMQPNPPAHLAPGPSPATNGHSHRSSFHLPQRTNGHTNGQPNGNSNGYSNGTMAHQDDDDDDDDHNDDSDFGPRPSSAPQKSNKLTIVTSYDDSDHERARRPQRPGFIRSKSERIVRHDDSTDHVDDEIYEWGARHGFEDHYQSEDIISHLANVSSATILALFER
jgi:hypothetical protein